MLADRAEQKPQFFRRVALLGEEQGVGTEYLSHVRERDHHRRAELAEIIRGGARRALLQIEALPYGIVAYRRARTSARSRRAGTDGAPGLRRVRRGGKRRCR